MPVQINCRHIPVERESVWRLDPKYMEQLRLQSELLKQEHMRLLMENARLRGKDTTRRLGVLPEPLKAEWKKAPQQPPGVFDRVCCSFSSASTATTQVGDTEDGVCKEPDALAEEVAGELRVADLGVDGWRRVDWPVHARKLRSKDKHHVSPSFEISPGTVFKLMLKPTPMGEKKGQASFHRARGCGSVELKLVDLGPFPAPTLRFRISVGKQLPRGPVEHNFNNSPVGGSAAPDLQGFNFSSSVDAQSSTFLVSLEILPMPQNSPTDALTTI